MPNNKEQLETDVLIIGTGPAGSTCAAALAMYGVKPMVVNKFGWTVRTPRAHITNPRAVEIFHDLGVKDDLLDHATPHTLMGEHVVCTSIAGEELGRYRTFGTEYDYGLNYRKASPENFVDLPQNYLEPIMLGAACHRGATYLNHTEFKRFEQDDDGVTSYLTNNLTDEEIVVRSKYLVGADGANSQVAKGANLPFEGQSGKSASMNIVFNADLTKLVAHRPTALFTVIATGADVGGLGLGVFRMVRPWHRWLLIWGHDKQAGTPEQDDEEALRILRTVIGDDSIPIELDSVSFWTVNERYATQLSEGRVYCMGDAVHSHPPAKGLGSNTSLQDAYNLAWKMAYVLKGKAGAALLDSYNQERAPIAKQIVTASNKSLQTFPAVLQTLGVLDTCDTEMMVRRIEALKEASPAAAKRRSELRSAIEATHDCYNDPGIELNQRYVSGAVATDEPHPSFSVDPERYHEISSHPGARLPHAWVKDGEKLISTLYLCGGGAFSILTGVNGQPWREIAKQVSESLDVPINVHVIGHGQRYADSHGEYARVSEVEEDGALLVRPDVYVGWRSKTLTSTSQKELEDAMRQILAL
ncbi:FAD-dependent monooxygenase (plasmid) [Sphingopyxis indica]|nr:FAD-dependent monooxygenase [Sphingopyxis indica]